MSTVLFAGNRRMGMSHMAVTCLGFGKLYIAFDIADKNHAAFHSLRGETVKKENTPYYRKYEKRKHRRK